MPTKTDLLPVGLFLAVVLLPFLPANAATAIKVDTKNLIVTVDAAACRWSAEVKPRPCG